MQYNASLTRFEALAISGEMLTEMSPRACQMSKWNLDGTMHEKRGASKTMMPEVGSPATQDLFEFIFLSSDFGA
jgi:hypothetical protein